MLDGVDEIDGSSADLWFRHRPFQIGVPFQYQSQRPDLDLVNNKLAYKYKAADKKITILGVGFLFHGPAMSGM